MHIFIKNFLRICCLTIGLDDNGNSSFTEYVLLNGPVKTKMVMVMEDLGGWKSSSAGIPIAKEELVLCLKNVAILHAKFWGESGKSIIDMENIGPCKIEKDFCDAKKILIWQIEMPCLPLLLNCFAECVFSRVLGVTLSCPHARTSHLTTFVRTHFARTRAFCPVALRTRTSKFST